MDLQRDAFFRRFANLHERARQGALDSREGDEYKEAKDRLAAVLCGANDPFDQPGRTARRMLRVASVFSLRIAIGDHVVRTVTMDVGASGFVAIVETLVVRGSFVHFELRLPRLEPLRGVAVVENIERTSSRDSHLTSFVFNDLTDEEQARLETALFDAILQRYTGAHFR
jgi:hypothetical protein